MAKSSFKPTKEQRSLVKTLAMFGIPYVHIAALIGRSEGVLLRYLEKELDQGYTEAVARVAIVAHEMAKSGKYPSMSKFWTATVGKSLKNIAVTNEASTTITRFRSPQPPTDGRPFKKDRNGYYVTEYRNRWTPPKPHRAPKSLKSAEPTELNDEIQNRPEQEGPWQEPN